MIFSRPIMSHLLRHLILHCYKKFSLSCKLTDFIFLPVVFAINLQLSVKKHLYIQQNCLKQCGLTPVIKVSFTVHQNTQNKDTRICSLYSNVTPCYFQTFYNHYAFLYRILPKRLLKLILYIIDVA